MALIIAGRARMAVAVLAMCVDAQVTHAQPLTPSAAN